MMLLKKQLFPMFLRSRGAVKCEKSTLEKGVSNRESTVGRLTERARGAESGVKAEGLTGVDTGLDIDPEPTPTEIRDGDKRADVPNDLAGPAVST
jgi:hypothetical protein